MRIRVASVPRLSCSPNSLVLLTAFVSFRQEKSVRPSRRLNPIQKLRGPIRASKKANRVNETGNEDANKLFLTSNKFVLGSVVNLNQISSKCFAISTCHGPIVHVCMEFQTRPPVLVFNGTWKTHN
ncbi:hypothetical protein ElyMa_001496100 [Elysia marginata]|uniref:Uncharacterized protein n=1 Tax=Elysia marginata TaxID=1093978 RepID=A0AAV4J3K8_9GAST|nr:hypothetical protein ElyMa_001496100 [Elysia marginata]